MLGVTILMGGMLLGQADPADASDLKLQVRRLVRQLNAGELDQREAAEKQLIELGPSVLGHLPMSPERAPAEVTQRVQRIRQTLQRAVAKSAGDASRVTLKGDAMPLSQILAAIEQQTGNKIIDVRTRQGGAGSDTKLKVEFDETPFWEALNQVLDDAGLIIYPYGEEKAVHLAPRNAQLPRVGRVNCSGPFCFEAVKIWAQRDLRDPINESLRLTLEAAWEPRLNPLSLKLPMSSIDAIDDQGNPLLVDNEDAEPEVPVMLDSVATELIIPLMPPPREVKKIAQLRGTLAALVPGRVESFRFEGLDEPEPVEKRIAGVSVTLAYVRKNNAVWDVGIYVRFDEASGALESHRTWIYENEAYLEDPDGQLIPFAAYDAAGGQTENELGVAYHFVVEGDLSGYAFIYKTPTLILSKTFEYEINDIDLP